MQTQATRKTSLLESTTCTAISRHFRLGERTLCVNNSQHNGMNWEEPSGSGNGEGVQSPITGRKLTSLSCVQMLYGKQVPRAITRESQKNITAALVPDSYTGLLHDYWGLTVFVPTKHRLSVGPQYRNAKPLRGDQSHWGYVFMSGGSFSWGIG